MFPVGMVALAALASAAAPASPGVPSQPLDERYAPGRLIVGYEPGISATASAQVRRAEGVRRVRGLRVRGHVELVDVPQGVSLLAAAREIAARPGVAYAEPDYLPVETAVPDDPQFGSMWVHRNVGGSGMVLDADMDTPQAWEVTTGSSAVRIGIADSGIAAAHEDLAANVFTNTADPPGGGDQDGNGYVDDTHGWDFIDQDNNPADSDGHGSMMAGVAAAVGNNATGVTGVNWRAAIVPLRRDAASTVAEAFTYAGNNNIRVVNASFALAASDTVKNAITGAPGTLFVASAGNSGESNEAQEVYPCTVPSANVVCVAATGPDDTLVNFSHYGATSVDVAAPGGWGIVSTEPDWSYEAYAESFDAGWGGWTHGAIAGTDRWDLHAGAGVGGTTALSDSPGAEYATFSQTWASSPPFSLAGREGCLVRQTLRGALVGANLYWEGSTDGTSWKAPGFFFGLPDTLATRSLPTHGIDGSATARVRYRLWTGSSTGEGATIDDVKVLCLGDTQSTYRTFTGGTSSAAAFVSGAAALLLAHEPGLTPSDIRTRLIDTADRKDALLDKTVSDGRINVARLIGAPIRPENVTAPSTTGAFSPGSTVSCQPGTWAESPTSYGYQWTRDGVPIPGAIAADYSLINDDGGRQVACTVTATNGDGSTAASSTGTTVAPARPVEDTTAPRATLTLVGRHRLSTLLRRGLRVACRVSEAARCALSLVISAREARRVGIRSGRSGVRLGRASVALPRRGTGYVTLKVRAKFVRKLKRAKRLTVTVRGKVIDSAGNRRSVAKTFRLR